MGCALRCSWVSDDSHPHRLMKSLMTLHPSVQPVVAVWGQLLPSQSGRVGCAP